MNFDEKDFKKRLLNNESIEDHFLDIKERIKKENIEMLPYKPTFKDKIKAFFASKEFKVSLATSGSLALVCACCFLGFLPFLNQNNQNVNPPIEKVAPVFVGVTVKEETTVISSNNAQIKKGEHPNLNLEESEFLTLDNFVNTDLELPADDSNSVDINTPIVLDVKLYNPNAYEIISLEIQRDGGEYVKYTNYMFMEGSDLTDIYINAGIMGDRPTSFHVGDIKYIDGTEIKICEKEGNDTIEVTPRYYEDFSLQNISKTIGYTNASFGFAFVDKASTLLNPKVYLTDGKELLIEDEIELGDNFEISFDSLYPNTTYEYGIYAYIDKKDGNSSVFTRIYDEKFTTPNYYESIDIKPSYNEIYLYINNLSPEASIDEVNVYDNSGYYLTTYNNFDSDLVITLDNLYSSREYYVEVIASLEGINPTNTVYQTTTLTYDEPTVEITHLGVLGNSVSFDIEIYDPNLLGNISKIELYENNQLVRTYDTVVTDFNNLNYESNYRIVVYYTFDLLDGYGSRTILAESSFRTEIDDITIENVKADSYAFANSQSEIEITLNNPSNINIEKIIINGEEIVAIKLSDTSHYLVNVDSGNVGENVFNITGYIFNFRGERKVDEFVYPYSLKIRVLDSLSLISVNVKDDKKYYNYSDPNEEIIFKVNIDPSLKIFKVRINGVEALDYSYDNQTIIVKPYANYQKYLESGVDEFNDSYYFGAISNLMIDYGISEEEQETAYFECNDFSDTSILGIYGFINAGSYEELKTISSTYYGPRLKFYGLNITSDIVVNENDIIQYENNLQTIFDNFFAVIEGNSHTFTFNFDSANASITEIQGIYLFSALRVFNINLIFEKVDILLQNLTGFYVFNNCDYANNVTIDYGQSFAINGLNGVSFSTFKFSIGFTEDRIYKYNKEPIYKQINIKGYLKMNLSNQNKNCNISLLAYDCLKLASDINVEASVNITLSASDVNISDDSEKTRFAVLCADLINWTIDTGTQTFHRQPISLKNIVINGTFIVEGDYSYAGIIHQGQDTISYRYWNVVIVDGNYYSEGFDNSLNPEYEINF